MGLERSQRAVLGLVVGIALGLGTVLPSAADASAPPPLTLTGVTLSGTSSSGNSPTCPTATYAVGGTATGAYPGTFVESGTLTMTQFSATFTITSGSMLVTGTKAFPFSTCSPIPNGSFGIGLGAAPYTATIHTPSGNFHDEGVSALSLSMTGSAATLAHETYTSSLTQPVLIVPTHKDQCKDGGWKNYPQFKNQGQCVSFVEHQGK
jgi:hypothetical protein